MFPMPRVIYSLATDGLIFKFLGWVVPRFKTPAAAIICSGLLAGNFYFDPFLVASNNLYV